MKGKCGHKKSIIYSDNPKMDTSGMSNEMTIEMMEEGGEIEVKDMGAVVKYGKGGKVYTCLLYTSPSPRDRQKSRMPSSA